MDKIEAKKAFGKNLKRIRTEKGLSQEELAKNLGYKGRSAVNKIETGVNDMPRSMVIKCAEVLGVSPLAFFEDEKPEAQILPGGGFHGSSDRTKLKEDVNALVKELRVFDPEDVVVLDSIVESPRSVSPSIDEFALTRAIMSPHQPESIAPDEFIKPGNPLLDTYKKLSPSSQEELEKYAEYLLAREKNNDNAKMGR